MNSDANSENYRANEPEPERSEAEAPRAAGYCRVCGRGLAEADIHRWGGVVYCESHVPAASAQGPAPVADWPASAAPRTIDTSVSPGLAFILGLIPGVGAIYNGQYAKGLIHVVIFGLLVSIIESGASGLEPLFGLLITAWIFYMAFEAHHTAKKRQAGLPVDEFSSLIPMKPGAGSTMGPIVLIVLGGFFLLLTLDLIELYQVGRYWPIILIALGVWMLVSRRSAAPERQE